MPDMLTTALEYTGNGWHVFPLLPQSKKPFKGSHGVKDATNHGGKIRQWWKETPVANIAIATGERSGFFVLDIDPRNGGNDALKELEAEHGLLPHTVMARTGGGGWHYLFRWPGVRIKNSNSKIGPGIDVKGDGGYIVAPPSVHDETAAVYEWDNAPDGTPIVDAPVWLLRQIVDSGTERTERTEKPEKPEIASALSVLSVPTLDDAIRLTLPVDLGQRHRRVFAFARALRAIPELAGVDLAKLNPIVKRWHRAALPHIRTKDFDTTWADFVAAWPRVRCPMGTGPMDDALKQAKRAKLPQWAKRYETAEVRLLVRLCRELQRLAGEGPFYISARIAGDAIGISKSNAGRLLSMLVVDKVLRIVEPGTNNRATRYRYMADAMK